MADARRIAIKTSKGMDFLLMEDILYCVAQGRYTRIVTISGQEYLLSKVLKEIECCLSCEEFFRTHKSYLINLKHLVNYQKNDEKAITLVNNHKVLLAKRRKQEFHERISELVQSI